MSPFWNKGTNLGILMDIISIEKKSFRPFWSIGIESFLSSTFHRKIIISLKSMEKKSNDMNQRTISFPIPLIGFEIYVIFFWGEQLPIYSSTVKVVQKTPEVKKYI